MDCIIQQLEEIKEKIKEPSESESENKNVKRLHSREGIIEFLNEVVLNKDNDEYKTNNGELLTIISYHALNESSYELVNFILSNYSYDSHSSKFYDKLICQLIKDKNYVDLIFIFERIKREKELNTSLYLNIYMCGCCDRRIRRLIYEEIIKQEKKQ